MNAKISESLGLVTMSEAKQVEIINPDGSIAPDEMDSADIAADEDRKYARENIKTVIEHGNSALEDVLDIARATEDPRAFEVFSNIMKTVIDANKTLVSINQNNSVRKGQKSQQQNDTQKDDNNKVTNQLFVGSTKELFDLINQQKGNDK